MANLPPKIPSAQPESSPKAFTIAMTLLAAVTVFRLWYITQIGLVADEAYYWLWSKHLAASYTDKGPVIAWLIAAGTKIFGDTAFGIRVLGVLLSAATGWQIFRLTRRLYGDRVGLWALVVATVVPLFGVGSVLMTIDTPSVFCWAWAANVFWTAQESGKVRHWFALGAIIGLGFLAKFTNGVQLGCVGLFLLWSAPHRKYIFSWQSIAMMIGFGLCSLPIVYWNYTVGWLQVAALHSRSGVTNTFEIHPQYLAQFLGEQIGILSPLIGIGMAVAAFGMLFAHHRDPRVRFLLCLMVPVYAIFCFFSLNSVGKGNWPVPGAVTGLILTVVFWREVTQQRPGWRWAPWAALLLAGFMTVVMNLAPFVTLPEFRFTLFGKNIHIPSINKFTNRSLGWPDYAAHIDRARKTTGVTLLIADHYSTVSLAEFYLPDHPVIYQPTGMHPQFELWGGYKSKLQPGERALFITTNEQQPFVMKNKLADEFGPPELVDDFYTQEQGRDIKRFRIFLITAK